MDKLNKTILLLALIALSLQTYLSNWESHSEKVVALTVPIVITTLLTIIYLCHPDDSEYTKNIEKILIYCAIISGIYCTIFLFGMQLGKAYKN